ncbi:MAG: patatin-like phospholipase family protein [Bacillota bacterium]
MPQRALVLGGGGVLGIAWMTGLTSALAEAGIHLSEADLFVGTSAGSVVGTQLAFGLPAEMLMAGQQAQGDQPTSYEQYVEMAALNAIYQKWFNAREMTAELRRELGQMALAAGGVPEERYVALFQSVLGDAPWPARPLKVTAVDVATGDFTVWDRDSGVPLPRAIASSCAVPGLFAPITIEGRRYMDGGVRSGTNADLAAGHERVLVIAPMGSTGHPLGHRQVTAEAEALRAGGSQVEVVVPDAQTLAVFGPSLMDSTRRSGSLEAGLRQGRELAATLRTFWNR